MKTQRVIIAVLASAALSWATWQAASTGWARTLGEDADRTDDAAAADRAVSLSPSDAETHAVRGEVLQRIDDCPRAVAEFQRAVQLRPRDYYLWMMLGVTEDQNGDQQTALFALKQSVSLAPTYAKPHWQLGNLLLRMNQIDQAFAELRRAASESSELLPNVIDLAWGVYGGDVNTVLTIVPPETDAARLELAIFFARHQQSSIAADQFLAAKVAPARKAEVLLAELLTSRAFGDAYRVWAPMHGLPPTGATGAIRNAGFESPITVDEAGFGWQIALDVTNVTMSIDTAEHQSGSKSLRIEFHGNSTPSQPLLTQLILVKPLTHYRLGLAALTKDFVSAADPVITLTTSSNPKNAAPAKTTALPPDPTVGRDFTPNFTTTPTTKPTQLTPTTPPCPTHPVPP